MTESRQLRVLIVRLGAMGDILHALPAVTALRAAHPEWVLGWAVEPRWAGLLCASLEDHAVRAATSPTLHQKYLASPLRGPEMPVVDRVHLVSAKRWGQRPLSPETWADMARVRRELRAERYDICIDLQGAVRSAMVARWAGAPRLIGEDQPREHVARWLFGERIPTLGRHVIEQCIEVAGAIEGQPLGYMPPELPRDPRAEAWCESWLAALPERDFVLLNPGAGWGAKRWPAQRYGEVAATLQSTGDGIPAGGYEVVVNAGPGEADLASEVVSASGGTAVAVTPSLSELIALTRRASLVIAGDTGPLHVASALGRPAVGIFGPTDPRRNGPFRSEFRILRHADSRRDHSRREQPEAGLLTISVDAVLDAALELLGLKSARQEPELVVTPDAASPALRGNS